MPHCSKCKKEKEKMRSLKTCEECAIVSSKYYETHKEQQAKTNKIWRSKNKDKLKKLSQKWKINHPDKWKESHRKSYQKRATTPQCRLVRAKNRATKNGIEFSINIEDYILLISNPCYYCDGYFGTVTRGIGLDRLDSSKGYIISNVVSCCKICNTIKSDFLSAEETKIAVMAILKHRFSQLLTPIQMKS